MRDSIQGVTSRGRRAKPPQRLGLWSRRDPRAGGRRGRFGGALGVPHRVADLGREFSQGQCPNAPTPVTTPIAAGLVITGCLALVNSLVKYPVLSGLPTWVHAALITGLGVAAVAAASIASFDEETYEWPHRLMVASIIFGLVLAVAGFWVGAANPVRQPPEPPAVMVRPSPVS